MAPSTKILSLVCSLMFGRCWLCGKNQLPSFTVGTMYVEKRLSILIMHRSLDSTASPVVLLWRYLHMPRTYAAKIPHDEYAHPKQASPTQAPRTNDALQQHTKKQHKNRAKNTPAASIRARHGFPPAPFSPCSRASGRSAWPLSPFGTLPRRCRSRGTRCTAPPALRARRRPWRPIAAPAASVASPVAGRSVNTRARAGVRAFQR